MLPEADGQKEKKQKRKKEAKDMTVVRGSVFVAGAQMLMPPRQQMAATSMILKRAPSWSRKAAIFANMPYTAVYPHTGQMQGRIHFGSIARRHRGVKGFEEGIPVIAARVRSEHKGYRAPDALPREAYPSRVRIRMGVLETRLRAVGKTI